MDETMKTIVEFLWKITSCSSQPYPPDAVESAGGLIGFVIELSLLLKSEALCIEENLPRLIGHIIQ